MPIFNQGFGGGMKPLILVSAPTGATISATKGSKTISAVETSAGYEILVDDYGTWTVTGITSGKTTTVDVDVVAVETYKINLIEVKIVVTADSGADVTATKGSTVINATATSSGYEIIVYDYGVWTVTGVKSGVTSSKTVDVEDNAVTYNVTLSFIPALNEATWAQIQATSNAGTGANYWSVGDTKQITINGKLSDGLTLSNYSTWVYIIGFDHNSSREGTGIAFQGFKTAQTGGVNIALCDNGYSNAKTNGTWFNMNNSNSTNGGWASSRMRTVTLPQVKNCLPSDLTAVIKSTTLYTDNTGGYSTESSQVTATADGLYLLAEYEIFGARSYANSAEQNYQKQYAYYSAGNSKVKYKHGATTSACTWLGRSAGLVATVFFCFVGNNGDVAGNTTNANYSYGLAPAFKV